METCRRCKKKPVAAAGLCRGCYSKEWRDARRNAAGITKRSYNAEVDYGEIDKLLRAGEHPDFIAASVGCAACTVHRRKAEIGLNHTRESAVHDNTNEPSVPMEVRFRYAMITKAQSLGMNIDTFKRVWLPGKTWSPDRGFE